MMNLASQEQKVVKKSMTIGKTKTTVELTTSKVFTSLRMSDKKRTFYGFSKRAMKPTTTLTTVTGAPHRIRISSDDYNIRVGFGHALERLSEVYRVKTRSGKQKTRLVAKQVHDLFSKELGERK